MGILFSVLLENRGEEDLIKSVETSSAEGHHSAEKDAEVLGSVLFVAVGGEGDEETTFSESGSGDGDAHWLS